MTVLVPQRRILKPRLSIPRLNFRRLGDPLFNRLGVRGQPWGCGAKSPSAVQSYIDKVLSYSPIAYWPLNESSGTNADNAEGTAARDGTYARDVSTMGTGIGIGDGNTAPEFDPLNDVVNVYSASLNGAFDGAEGTMQVWMRVSAASVWTDGANRRGLAIAKDSSQNRNYLTKDNTNNKTEWLREGGNVNQQRTRPTTTTDWFHMAMTWSQANDRIIAYFDGLQVGAVLTGLGVWVDPLASSLCCIGARSTSLSDPFSGRLAHAALWSSELSAADISDLATV